MTTELADRRMEGVRYMDHSVGYDALACLHYWLHLDHLKENAFLMQGTALGAYRDGGFTPTEKDIDVGIIYDCRKTLMAWYDLVHNKGLRKDFEVESYSRPFKKTRTLCLWFHGQVKIDLVLWLPWTCKDGRKVLFTVSPERPWNVNDRYALVHDEAMLISRQIVTLDKINWDVPSPIEKYLELEYGPDWRTPADDHVSRTRDYDFMTREEVSLDII